MSVRVLSQVLRESQSTGSSRLVLIALADVAGDSGEVIEYPRSHKILAAKANCSEGTVRKAIRDLEALGEVEVLVVGDGRTKSDYRIHLPGLEIEGSPDRPPGGSRRRGRGVEIDPEGSPDRPPITTSLSVHPPSLHVVPSAESFDALWSAYPKRAGVKVGKVAAAREWGKLSAEEREAALAGLPGYTKAARGYPQDAERYLKHRRWVGLEVETEADAAARSIAGAESLAEFFNVKGV